jgi:hypothetical protein
MDQIPNPAAPESAMLAMLKVFADLFWQVDARFSALKTVVSELHPEVADRLEALIQQNIRENRADFEKQQEIQKLLQAAVSKIIQ